MHTCRFVPSWICHLFACMGGCFGCCTKPPLIIDEDESSKGLRIQGRKFKKLSISEDFWSTSAGDMDYSALQSQQSISSISTPNQPHDAPCGSSNPSEFVNYGLLLWNQTRQQWVGNKKTKEQSQVQEPTIRGNANYESLLGTSKPFPRPIHLPEMVDFLVDVWKQEGSYD